MEKVMLSFDKVSAHYGKIQALHEVSLHINQGEIVTLIGANGAGKTTLLGTLCGDPRATSGRIVFDDKDITDWQTVWLIFAGYSVVLAFAFMAMFKYKHVRIGASVRAK